MKLCQTNILLFLTISAVSLYANSAKVTGWNQSGDYYGSLNVSVSTTDTNTSTLQIYYPQNITLTGSGWGGSVKATCTAITKPIVTGMNGLNCQINPILEPGSQNLTFGLSSATPVSLQQNQFLVGDNGAQPAQGDLKLSLSAPDTPPSYQPIITVDNKPYTVSFSAPTDVKLYVGTHQIDASSFVSGQNVFVPSFKDQVDINANQTTQDSVSYQPNPLTLSAINFDVSGLANQSTTATVNGNNYQASYPVSNGTDAIKVPNLGTYRVTFNTTADGHYASPGAITVTDGKALSSTQVHYIPKGVYMVGYIDYGSIHANLITEAVQQGYTMIVIGFANFNTDNKDQVNLTGLDQSRLWNDMTAARAYAKANGIPLKILISFGGANGSFHQPDIANIKTAIANIVAFAKKPNADTNNYFDGVDFDIEEHVDPAMLKALTTGIKAQNLLVTAAPQVNNDADGQMEYVTAGTDQDYDAAIQAGGFDYLFVQEYNTGSACFNNVCEGQQTFASVSFPRLAALVQGTGTKVVIGEPATTYAATGSASTGSANPSNIFYAATQSSAASQTVLSTLAAQVSQVNSLPSFGGIMTWAVNLDAMGGNYLDPNAPKYQTPWEFVQTESPAL